MEHVISATLELNDKFTSRIQKSEIALKRFENSNRAITTSFKNGFDRATTGLDNFSEKFIRNKDKIASAGNKIFTSVTAGGLAAGAFVKNSFDKYANLQETLSRNGALTGANLEEQKRLAQQTRQLGKDTRYSALQIAQAQQYQAMAGYKTNEILALTPKLLKFATASGSDLAESADIITDNLDAFGLKLSEVDDLMDTMAATANNSNTNISMLGEAYKYVASTSKGFDDFKEVNVLLGILSNNGIKAGIAGRNLAGIYARLAKADDSINDALKRAGTSLYDQNGKFRGLRTIISETKPALEKMTEQERNFILTTIAGTEGLKIWNAIMNYSVEGTEKVADAVYNSNGAIEKQNEIMSKTPKAKVDELKSSFEELQLAIGEGVAPVAIELMEDLKNKIKDVTSSDTFNKENMQDYFSSLKDNIQLVIAALGGLKLATLATTNPYLAGGTVAVAGGTMFGNWLFNKTNWGKNFKQGWIDRQNKRELARQKAERDKIERAKIMYANTYGEDKLKADTDLFAKQTLGNTLYKKETEFQNDNYIGKQDLYKMPSNVLNASLNKTIVPIQVKKRDNILSSKNYNEIFGYNNNKSLDIKIKTDISLNNLGLTDENIKKIARESAKETEKKIITELKTATYTQ